MNMMDIDDNDPTVDAIAEIYFAQQRAACTPYWILMDEPWWYPEELGPVLRSFVQRKCVGTCGCWYDEKYFHHENVECAFDRIIRVDFQTLPSLPRFNITNSVDMLQIFKPFEHQVEVMTDTAYIALLTSFIRTERISSPFVDLRGVAKYMHNRGMNHVDLYPPDMYHHENPRDVFVSEYKRKWHNTRKANKTYVKFYFIFGLPKFMSPPNPVPIGSKMPPRNFEVKMARWILSFMVKHGVPRWMTHYYDSLASKAAYGTVC